MISGDFNIDLLKFGSHSETDEFMNILGTHFFQPRILQPTRITNHSATLIDNIFFNSLDHFAISGNIINDISDHMANFLIINKFSSLPDNVKIYNRDYSKLDQSALIQEVQRADWEDLFSNASNVSNPSTFFYCFYTKISDIVDKHIPIKELSKKEKKVQSKPWITHGIRTSIQIKNKFYKKYLKQNTNFILIDLNFIEIRLII